MFSARVEAEEWVMPAGTRAMTSIDRRDLRRRELIDAKNQVTEFVYDDLAISGG